LGIGLNLALALVVLLRRRPGLRRAVTIASPAVVGGLMALAHVTLADSWNRAFSLGMWRVRNLPASVGEYRRSVDQVDLRYHRDGAGSTVAVNGWTNPATGTGEITLRVNGKADATSRGDLSTQLLLAHLPLLLQPRARDVMIVGVGSGITCAAALTHAPVRRVDAVEISPEVVAAARTQFAPYNRGALDHQRVSVVIDDAKSFLQTSGRTYDVIVSEPSNPWMAGVAGVFSREFYETCAASLNEDGVMVQWVHIYESNDDALRTVLGTFGSGVSLASPSGRRCRATWSSIGTRPGRRGRTWLGMERRFPRADGDSRTCGGPTSSRLPALLGLQVVSDDNAPVPRLRPTPSRHGDFLPVLEYQRGTGVLRPGRRDAARGVQRDPAPPALDAAGRTPAGRIR
jgi:SAM-dependent methyltransferase